MTELILGTAEFNPKGYADRACPDEKEIVRILNLAYDNGICGLDTADSYGCNELLDKYAQGFWRIVKGRDGGEFTFYHYQPGEARKGNVRRASVYDIDQLYYLEEAIVPLNINNTAFSSMLKGRRRTYIRSVFDRGRLLKQGYTVKDCLSFVARHEVTGIIVGVSSTKELEEILSAWQSIKKPRVL